MRSERSAWRSIRDARRRAASRRSGIAASLSRAPEDPARSQVSGFDERRGKLPRGRRRRDLLQDPEDRTRLATVLGDPARSGAGALPVHQRLPRRPPQAFGDRRKKALGLREKERMVEHRTWNRSRASPSTTTSASSRPPMPMRRSGVSTGGSSFAKSVHEQTLRFPIPASCVEQTRRIEIRASCSCAAGRSPLSIAVLRVALSGKRDELERFSSGSQSRYRNPSPHSRPCEPASRHDRKSRS